MAGRGCRFTDRIASLLVVDLDRGHLSQPMTEAEANGICANQWGTVLKLTSAQIERTLRHFDAQAIPESHPLLPRLNELFGDHTFFVDSNGLNIMEG
jgi:hypothetical protein